MRTNATSRSRRRGTDPKLSMTPMIDVVFLLLVFFVVTIEPVDILAALSVARPQPDSNPAPPPDPGELITIEVHPTGYSVNRSWMGFAEIRTKLHHLGAISTRPGILVICYMDSTHSQLIRVLDLCAEVGFENLSVMTR